MKQTLKANLPYLIGITIAGLLHFLPFLLSGDVLYASDQIASPAWKPFLDALKRGELMLWNPYALGGMPVFDSLAGDGTYPPFLLLGLFFPIEKLTGYNLMLHCLLGGWLAYVLLRGYFRLDRLLGAALAVAYMLNTYFVSLIYSGHTGKVYVLAWLPLGLYFLLKALGRDAKPRHLAGLALTTSVMILTSHLQFTYYVLMGYFLYYAYVSFAALRARAFRETATLALRFWGAVLLGIGLCFPLFYAPLKYNQDFSVRGEGERQTYEHATSWSLHPEETASLVVPEFGGINERYWGRNPFKLNSEYPGIALWVTGLVGLAVFRRRGYFILWAAVGALAILYGLGAHTPLFRLFYAFVPGVKSFRAPSMMLFWLGAALLLMAAQALRLLTVERASLKLDWNRLSRRTLRAGLVASGVLLAAGLFSGAVYGIWDAIFSGEHIPNLRNQPAAQDAFVLGALRAGVLVLALTLAFRAWIVRERNERAFALVLGLVALVDLYWVGSHFVDTYKFAQAFPQEAAVEYVKKDTAMPRVFVVPGTLPKGYTQYHGLHNTGDWFDQEYRVYRAYRGGDYNRNPYLLEGLRQNPDGTLEGNALLDMLNVKYLLFRVPESPRVQLAENRSVMPRAWFVTRWEQVAPDLQLDRMRAPGFNPRELALVDTALPSPSGPASARADIRREMYRNNALRYAVANDETGIFVLSENWFPYWRVTVDGVRQPLLRVNYLFRGVYLEPGEHVIEMRYVSPRLRNSLWISLASVAGIALLAWAWGRMARIPSEAA